MAFGDLISAAAAEDKNESDDYKPNVSVVKKIAQAVIHSSSPFSKYQEHLCSLLQLYERWQRRVIDKMQEGAKKLFLKNLLCKLRKYYIII